VLSSVLFVSDACLTAESKGYRDDASFHRRAAAAAEKNIDSFLTVAQLNHAFHR
jgi:hypothetical protein